MLTEDIHSVIFYYCRVNTRGVTEHVIMKMRGFYSPGIKKESVQSRVVLKMSPYLSLSVLTKACLIPAGGRNIIYSGLILAPQHTLRNSSLLVRAPIFFIAESFWQLMVFSLLFRILEILQFDRPFLKY